MKRDKLIHCLDLVDEIRAASELTEAERLEAYGTKGVRLLILKLQQLLTEEIR